MNDTQKLKHCRGCHDDVYNHGCGGSKRCWMLDSMQLVRRKEVHINQVPPWKQKPKMMPKCYHRPQFVFVDGNRTN